MNVIIPAGLEYHNLEIYRHHNTARAIYNGKTVNYLDLPDTVREPFQAELIANRKACNCLRSKMSITNADKVDYIQQFKNLKDDEILCQLLCEHTMVAADNKMRKMVCLPEFFIYGYIFSIQSPSKELQAYKLECYRVLYEHFHGAIVGRKELLSEKARLQIKIDACMNTLDPEVALALDRAKTRMNAINGQLRSLDSEVMEEEKTLFDS